MKKKEIILFMFIFAATLLYTIFGEGSISYVMGGDTEAYYLNFHHHIGVSPGYPLFIHIIETICGNEIYLHVVAALQILFLAGAILVLVYTIFELFVLQWWETLIVWGFSMLPFIFLLPEDPIGHVLMTESLTYPLFYIFMAMMLRGVIRKKEVFFFYGLLLTILMALIRPQMQFAFAVVGIAFVYTVLISHIKNGKSYIRRKSWLVKSMVFFCCIVLGMKSTSWLASAYEKHFFNAEALSYSDQTLVQRLLYLASDEDVSLFEDEVTKEVYQRTWQKIQEMQTGQQYYDRSWKSWTEIFQAFGANSRILGSSIREILSEKDMLATDPIGQEVQVSEISHEVTVKLMQKYWRQHFSLSFQLLPKSFISTVLFHDRVHYGLLWLLTCLAYFTALAGSLWIFIKKKSRAGSAEFMLLTVGTSIVNALACDLVLAGLQRYMAYTLGMTWIGLFLLARAVCCNADKNTV